MAVADGFPVNALGRETTREMRIKPPEPVTAEHIDGAKERLILAWATHLDSLAARLAEKRVRKVIEPLIAGMLPEADAACRMPPTTMTCRMSRTRA